MTSTIHPSDLKNQTNRLLYTNHEGIIIHELHLQDGLFLQRWFVVAENETDECILPSLMFHEQVPEDAIMWSALMDPDMKELLWKRGHDLEWTHDDPDDIRLELQKKLNDHDEWEEDMDEYDDWEDDE